MQEFIALVTTLYTARTGFHVASTRYRVLKDQGAWISKGEHVAKPAPVKKHAQVNIARYRETPQQGWFLGPWVNGATYQDEPERRLDA